ncbi:MAG: PAS domain-containing protein [Proteobacteria bacterium]|nr:PAS domain-containing protein [Pseudomonadota bacterium]
MCRVHGIKIEGNYDIERTQIFFSPLKIRFAAPKGEKNNIISTLDAYFSKMKANKNSIYYDFFDKWMGAYKGKKGIPEWVKWTIGGILLFLILSLFFAYLLKKEVSRKTSQLVKATGHIRESETRFRQLAENINEVYWIASTDWKDIFYISPAYENIWGRSCESLYASPTSWMDSIYKDDIESVKAFIRQKKEVISRESNFRNTGLFNRTGHSDGFCQKGIR